jgi:Gram-negative bacterial TonB protein C-terminal
MSNGTLEDIMVLRDPGGGLGDAAKQAVLESVKKGIKWIPGMEKGEPVNVQYTVPLKFTLNGRNR